VVTDLLYNFGTVVSGATTILEAPIEGALWSPTYAISAVLVGLRDPAMIGSLLSFVGQTYLNPAYDSWPALGLSGLADIASVLPAPLGTWLTAAVAGTSARIGSLFDALPDPGPGASAFSDFVNNDFIGNIVDDINWLALAPVYSIADTMHYLAYLPYDVEATFESALRNPAEIPGLISNLVWGLVEPYNGLLGQIVDNFVAPLTYLPGIGEVIANVYTAIADGVQNLLDRLPTPVTPTPFLSSSAAPASTALVSTLPSATGAVTLDVPKTADQLSPATDPQPKKIAPQPVPAGDVPDDAPTADVQDVDNSAAKDAEGVKDAEDAEGVKDAEDAEGVKDVEGAEGAGKADETKPAQRIGRHRADDKKPSEQKATEHKATEQKATEQKPAEQKPAVDKPSEQKTSEQKADAAA
jgi:hypothetical protein